MMKRIIALLLALILTVGLLPTVALADDAQPDVQVSKSDDNLNLVKTIKKAGENYTVTLESWATGTVTSSSTPVPMDIILLLDQSGSMNSDFTSSSSVEYNRLYKKNQKIYEDYRDRLYIYNGSGYVKVSVEKETILFSKDKFTYTWSGGSYVSYGERDYPDRTFYYQSTNSSKTTKIAALKSAVNSFIDKVNTEATTKNVDHRVAVVGFASTSSDYNYYENTELLSTTKVVNYGSASDTNYENALVSAKTNKDRLDTAIKRLDASGDTYPEYGFDMANKIFAQYPIQAGENRQRVVIMFTDGYPAPARKDDFNVQMANNAIYNAKGCKDNNAKVYTIGIFNGADPSASIENYSQNGWLNQGVAANRYMHFSSSNYPSATALGNGGTRGEGNFYFAASNADALNDIFDTISEEISTDTTELDDSATIIDNIPGNFAIPEDAQNITLKVAKFQKDGTFATATTAPTTVTAEHKDGTVTVTGFNFSDEWCGLNESDQPHGSKLIIEFTIHHNNYGGTQPTNAGAGIKDKEGNEVIKVDDPTVPVTISKPVDIFASAIEKTYDGTGFDILNKVAEKANSLADGTKNKFVNIEVEVKVDSTDYIYTILAGQTAGTWNQAGTPKTSPNVKATTLGTAENYEYPVTITFKDAAQGSNAWNSTNTNAKFKINYAEVTVKAKDKTKKTTEADPTFDATVTGMVNGEKAEDKLNYTISRTDATDNTVGNHNTITPAGDTYQNNYEVTYETGTLTITMDDTPITVTITGKQETKEYNGQTQTVTGFDYTVTGAEKNDVTVTLNQSGKDSASGKDVTTANEGKYMMGLTASAFNVSSTKYSNVTITTVNDGWLKITPLAVTLTSGSGSKEYDGEPLTNATVEATGAGAKRFLQEVNDFKATGSVTGTADMTVAQSETNTISYTWKEGFSASNYTITTNLGTLTITPVSQLKITFKTETGGKIDGGTAPIEKTVQRNGSFPAVPTTEANTGYYFLGWYDESGNKVEENAFPEKVTGNATYTAKWLSYNSINLDLTGKIQKTLNSDVALTNETFTINLTLNGAEVPSATATATATATVSPALDNGSYTDTKPFVVASGDFKLTFTAPGIYNYSIVEEAPTRSGMTYDVNKPTDGHELTVNVTADDTHALRFESVTVDGTSIADVTVPTTWLTIANTYTEPKEPSVVSKTVVTTDMVDTLPHSVSSDIAVFKNINQVDILYPVVNGEASTLEVPYGTKSVTLLYKITVNAGTKTSMQFEDVGAECVSIVDDDDVDVSQVKDNFTVQFYRGVTTADIYVAKTYTNLVFDSNGECTVENAIGEIKATTTVTEKDPDKLYLDFSKYVQKELAATGSKTASDVSFRVIVNGMESPIMMYNAGEEEVSTYVEFDPRYSTVLDVNFASITGGSTETKDFTGSYVEIDQVGIYYFELNEEDGKRTGVTYDDSTYKVYVYVKREGDKLVVGSFDIYKDGLSVAGETITFHNTIDTGRDDYIPIIIPTIINKDTGMLNKTDHFAYVIGYPDGTVHPNGQITRAEVATIFFRLLRDEVRDGAFTTSNSYSDVAYGKWYNNPISTMSALGIITGYPDGTFKPNKPITRAEFAAIAARFDETQSGKSATFSDVIGHWAAKEIGIAYYNDWIKGYPDGTFKPDQNITRAEAMTLINRVLERKPESPADLLTNMNKWTDNMDTSKWYYLDVQEATNSHGYTRKTFNYELWRQMLPDPDWSRYER